jgi:hypothetical protein
MDAMRFLRLSPAKYEAAVLRLSSSERCDLEKELEHIAATAAFAATYVGERYGYGCGDQSHKTAVRKANVTKRRVRKAFGYSETPELRI